MSRLALAKVHRLNGVPAKQSPLVGKRVVTSFCRLTSMIVAECSSVVKSTTFRACQCHDFFTAWIRFLEIHQIQRIEAQSSLLPKLNRSSGVSQSNPRNASVPSSWFGKPHVGMAAVCQLRRILLNYWWFVGNEGMDLGTCVRDCMQ